MRSPRRSPRARAESPETPRRPAPRRSPPRIPASPNPIAIRARSASASPALSMTSPTTARRTAIAAAKSTWIFAAAPARLGERLAVGVAQPRAAAGRAAVDAERRAARRSCRLRLERRSSPSPPLCSAFAASADASRLALAARRVCRGVAGRCTKTAGVALRLSRRYCKRAEIEMVADEAAGVPRHPRRNSRLSYRVRDRADRRRRLEPFGRARGDRDRLPQPRPDCRARRRRPDCARTARRRRRRAAPPGRSSGPPPAGGSRSPG